MSFPSMCSQHFNTFVACQVGKCLEGNWPKGNVAAGWFNYFSLCRIISFIVKSHSALPCTNCFVGFLPTGKVGAGLNLAALSPGKVGAGLSLPTNPV